MQTKFNDDNQLIKKEIDKLKESDRRFTSHSMLGNKNFKNLDPFQRTEIGNIQNYKNKLTFLKSKPAININQIDIDIQELDSELYEEIKILWTELGIKHEYQNEFEPFIVNTKNLDRRMKFLSLEKNNLIQLKKSLIKFMKEKEFRSKNIGLLKELNSGIYISILKEKRINSSLIKQVIDCIKDIRISSINLVRNIIKIRENLAIFFNKDKIDMDVLYKNFLFENSYLLKMNFELNFLKSSEINKVFEINEEENLDTFLTLYDKIKNNEDKYVNNVSIEILNAIEKCRYYIFQEGIANKLKPLNRASLSNCNKRIFLLSKNNFIKKKDNDFFQTSGRDNNNRKLKEIKTNLGRNYGKLFLNSIKKIKIPKTFLKKSRDFTSKPKTNVITIERENGKYEENYMNYLEKKFLKSANDNIKSKEEEEKKANFENFIVEKTEIINFYSQQNQTDNDNNVIINENDKKEETKENNNIVESKNNEIIMNNNNDNENNNNNIDSNLNEKEGNNKNNLNNNNYGENNNIS